MLRTDALAEIHANSHPVLLAVDLEWATSNAGRHIRPGYRGSCLTRDSGPSHCKRGPTEWHGERPISRASSGVQLSLLQLCVEKQGRRDLWPPSCSANTQSCAPMQPLADPAVVVTDARLPAPPCWTSTDSPAMPWARGTVSRAGLAAAIAAAVDIGSVCLFDLAIAPDGMLRPLGQLLEHPGLPKIVRSRCAQVYCLCVVGTDEVGVCEICWGWEQITRDLARRPSMFTCRFMIAERTARSCIAVLGFICRAFLIRR